MVRAIKEAVTLESYFALRRRFEAVIERLTKLGRIEEADYHMIYFFIFLEELERLRDYVIESERMLENGEW